MFLGCKILILPKSNQIYPNLTTYDYDQISPQFCPNFTLILPKYAQIQSNLPKSKHFA